MGGWLAAVSLELCFIKIIDLRGFSRRYPFYFYGNNGFSEAPPLDFLYNSTIIFRIPLEFYKIMDFKAPSLDFLYNPITI